MTKKKGFAPQAGELFWNLHFDDTSASRIGLIINVSCCPVDEDFSTPELQIFKTKKQATYVRNEMMKTWKKCLKKIHG